MFVPNASFASIPTTIAHAPESALAHGVRVARRLKTHLEIVRVQDAPAPAFLESARSDAQGVLRRWRAKDPSALRVDAVQTVWTGPGDPASDDAFCASLADTPASLLVVNRRAGLGSPAAQASLAAAVAFNARAPVLAVGDEDVVDPTTGEARLSRILVPVSTIRNVQALTEASVWFASILTDEPFQIVFVHVRSEPTAVAIRPPVLADDSIQFTTRVGEPVPALVAEAVERRVDAVVLPLGIEIGGGGAILDSGSLEALMRALPMPVLVVPARRRWHPDAAPDGVRVLQGIPAAPRLRGRTNALRLS